MDNDDSLAKIGREFSIAAASFWKGLIEEGLTREEATAVTSAFVSSYVQVAVSVAESKRGNLNSEFKEYFDRCNMEVKDD